MTENDTPYIFIGLLQGEDYMSFTEKLMRDRETQIMAISIVFFVLAFPTYFFLAANNADSSAGLNTVNTYVIEGNLTYVELASGNEFIADGDTFPIDDLSTDSIDDADELNIIGVRLSLSYTESEVTSGACQGPLGGQPAADSITGMTMHGDYNETATGSNNGDSGSHSVDIYWANTSLIGERVNMSKAEIMAEIDAGDIGLGAYSGSISVDAEAGSTPAPEIGPACERSDAGEEVTYKLELVIFDYEIELYSEPEGV